MKSIFKAVYCLSLVLFSNIAFGQTPVQSYEQLLTAIRETRAASQQRIEAAVEAEKVREAWEIGKLIDEHVLIHKERADYGAYVVKKLSEDLGIDRTELYRMLEFARIYPIVGPAQQLSWSHYSSLLSLNDPEQIKELAVKAEKEKWTRNQVREEVQRRKGNVKSQEPLTAFPGKTGVYRISKNYAGELYLDLGFSNYLKLGKKMKFKEGDIVEGRSGKLKKSSETGLSYTYTGHVLNVLDGDTLRVEIDLGFDFTSVQKLRLRSIDAPEIESAEGKEAKALLEKLLAGRSIILKTARSDKYDRYLADLWAGDIYINQKLLDENLAVRVSE